MGSLSPGNAAAERVQDPRAAAYGRRRRRLFAVSRLLDLAVPWLVWTSGLSAALWSAAQVAPLEPLRVPLFVALLGLLTAAIGLPSAWYGGFRLPHQFGLSRQTVRAWLADWFKAALLGVGLGTLAVASYYAAHPVAGARWWLLFGAAMSLAALLLTFVAPYLIVPIFFRMQPLERPEVVDSVKQLADQAGASVRDVCTLDFSRRTVEANAAVIGLGRSRRVVLADTLLDQFTLPEVRAVVAHELGHHVHRDIVRLLGLQAVLLWSGLGLAALLGERLLAWVGAAGGLAEPPNLPLLMLGLELFGLLTLPLSNLLARRIESAADRFALRVTGDPDAFRAALQKLARQNLAELWPPRWAEALLHTHPALGRRILVAEQFERAA